MSFWNFIGEFFLFGWLFGHHKHDTAKCDEPDATVNRADSVGVDEPDSYMRYGSRHSQNSYSGYANHDYDYSHSYDDFLDEQDDYDMMDDDF